MAKRSNRLGSLRGDPIEIKIEGMSHEGRGVGRVNGKVAFVQGALPGEVVQAVYQKNRSQFSDFKAIEILKSSPDRVKPPCIYSDTCGGCALQHLSSESQLTFKENVLIEQLESIAGLKHTNFYLLPKLQAKVLGYRRKARLGVRNVAKKGGVLVGFREKNSGFIMDMESCKVINQRVSSLIIPLRQMLTSLGAASDIPQIEVAVGDSQTGALENNTIALVFRHLADLSERDIELIKNFGATHGIEIYLQPGGIDSVEKISNDNGKQRLYYSLPAYSLKLGFHPMDFTQINGEMNTMIVDRVVEMLDLHEEDSVLDLFCGLGNFTLPIATKVNSVTGVEASQEMVERAKENASQNKLFNVKFFAEDLYKLPVTKAWTTVKYTKVVLDPPRTGAYEILPTIVKKKPEKIMYVSCNPSTLARDAKILDANNYQLKSAGVMDMFPHTSHVESIAEFVRT